MSRDHLYTRAHISLWSVSACALLVLLTGIPSSAESVHYVKQIVDKVTVHTAYVDLRDPSILVTPGVALDEPRQRKSFNSFQEEAHPLAQITGSFFDLRSGEPIGDIVVNGRQLFITMGIGTALALTRDNRAFMFDFASPRDLRDWSKYESVLQGGVRLVRQGLYAVDPQGQGFHDLYMMRKTRRIAVGILPDDRLVLVGIGENVWLPDLADIMLRLGCQEAMALDGGGSTGFSCGDRRVFSTGRKLANVLMVVRRPYDAMASFQMLLTGWHSRFDLPESRPQRATVLVNMDDCSGEEAPLLNAFSLDLDHPLPALEVPSSPYIVWDPSEQTAPPSSPLAAAILGWLTALLHWDVPSA